MAQEEFLLLGHSSPLGRYPAPVIPVGRLDEKMVAIYARGGEPDVVPIAAGCSYVAHDASLRRSLSEFDYRSHRLFALEEDRILSYPIEREREFFLTLLKNSQFSEDNPFFRLSLAKSSREASAIERELRPCVEELSHRALNYLDAWIEEEKQSVVAKVGAPNASRLLKLLDTLRASSHVAESRPTVSAVGVTMKELLEAGVHFGHQVRRWNPKMKEFIFGERNGINIIDLQKTQKMFRDAISFVTSLMGEDRGRNILFVGTKRQAQDAIREEAERAQQYYINQRWLGGLLTNFQTVQKSIKRLRDLEAMQTDGRYEKLTKKERIKLDREREKLEKNLSGIKNMTKLPDALFIIDVGKEDIAVREANRLGIPVIAVVDTNWSPEGVDYVIPGNDDALRAVRLFASRIADAVIVGRRIAGEDESSPLSSERQVSAPAWESSWGVRAETTESVGLRAIHAAATEAYENREEPRAAGEGHASVSIARSE
jgi:small subunit ribosomal protein S2